MKLAQDCIKYLQKQQNVLASRLFIDVQIRSEPIKYRED